MFVSKHENNSVTKLILVQHFVELITCSLQTVGIVRINNEDQSLRVLVVVSPQWTNLVLSSNIPNCERNVLVVTLLDVETNAVKCERKEGGKRERERKGSEERSVRISCAVEISENDVGQSCNRRKEKAQRNFSMAK